LCSLKNNIVIKEKEKYTEGRNQAFNALYYSHKQLLLEGRDKFKECLDSHMKD
jgi:hypothetical protein